jgi:probable addiction module antidote protein
MKRSCCRAQDICKRQNPPDTDHPPHPTRTPRQKGLQKEAFCVWGNSTGSRWRIVRSRVYKCERQRMTVQKMIELSKFDAADYLDSQETVIAYLNEALEFGDADFIYHALETIARAKGMTDFIKDTGIGSTTKPDLETVRRAIDSFGLKLIARPVQENNRS